MAAYAPNTQMLNQALKLGYSENDFLKLSPQQQVQAIQSGDRVSQGISGGSVLDQNTKYTPQVQATSVMPQVQDQQMSMASTQNDPFNMDQMSYDTPTGSKSEPFNLVSTPSAEMYTDGNNQIYDQINNPTTPAISAAEQNYADNLAMDTKLKEQNLLDAQAFDWMGAANVGFQGLNTAMEVGMYGDKKDYMNNVNKGLEQNMRNAQATHDNRATQQQNLGSTFSRNT